MATDGDHLLRMILEQPAEDSHRLVYADWLEENGQPERAEFIRLQIEHRNYNEAPSDIQLRLRYLRRVTHPHGLVTHPHGLGCLIGDDFDETIFGSYKWERGFISEIHTTFDVFMEKDRTKQLFSRHPITKVVLTDREPAPSNLYPGLWRWWADSNVPQESLGYDFYAMLEGYIPPEGNQPYWNSFEEAMAALSVACFAYGRKQAGLPALEAANK
jgi:uncharacterized protein (TIGR02996 family)